MCESHNKLHARFAFFKSHEYRHKNTSFISINTKLFFTCDDYSNGKYLSIRNNLLKGYEYGTQLFKSKT